MRKHIEGTPYYCPECSPPPGKLQFVRDDVFYCPECHGQFSAKYLGSFGGQDFFIAADPAYYDPPYEMLFPDSSLLDAIEDYLSRAQGQHSPPNPQKR